MKPLGSKILDPGINWRGFLKMAWTLENIRKNVDFEGFWVQPEITWTLTKLLKTQIDNHKRWSHPSSI